MQIRHGSLESARLSANYLILEHAGKKQYKVILREFPHHVIHENKQAIGADVDHVSDRTRRSFGKAVGTAAHILKSETVFTTYCDVKDAETVKDIFYRVYNKMSSPCRIVADHDEEPLVA